MRTIITIVAAEYDRHGCAIDRTIIHFTEYELRQAFPPDLLRHFIVPGLEVSTFIAGHRADYVPLQSTHGKAGTGR